MPSAENSPTPDRPRNSPLVIGLVGGLVLMTMGGFVWLASLWWGTRKIDAHQTLRLASSQFVAGNLTMAGDLASRATLDDEVEEEQVWISLKNFLMGAGLHSQAQKAALPRERREWLAESIPLLERSEKRGFPDGRSAAGHRMLGWAKFELERYPEAVLHFEKAIDSDLTLRLELLPLMARAIAAIPSEPPERALRMIKEYLADRTLDIPTQASSELVAIDLLLRSSQWDEAQAAIARTLALINADVEQQRPWAIDFRDELVLASARRMIDKTIAGLVTEVGQIRIGGTPVGLEDQIKDDDAESLRLTSLDLIALRRESTPTLAAKARLLLAQVDCLIGQKQRSLNELTAVRQLRPFNDQGLEAGMTEIELLAHEGRGEEVLQTTRFIIREIAQSQQLNFSLPRRDEFSRRMIAALSRLRQMAQYDAAADVAGVLQPVVTSAAASLQRGIAMREWGEATLKEGVGPNGEVSRKASATARQYFRAAGDAFAQSADLKYTTDEYLPTLWNAIDAYQRGRHFRASIDLLQSYLRYEQRGRQSQGLVALGRALLAEGDARGAIEPLQTCILEQGRDPLRYDARLLAAKASEELGEFEQAKTFLTDNLRDGQLSPESPVWRDSLFTLAGLLFRDAKKTMKELEDTAAGQRDSVAESLDQKLAQARRRLDESVKRGNAVIDAQIAAYQLAQAHLMTARLPLLETESVKLTESAQRDVAQRVTRARQAALDEFSRLIGELDDQQRDADLSDQRDALLRNAMLGQADTLAEMGRWGEAADAYRDMALRLMNEPASLEAILGQSRMVRKLGRNREADLLIRQASVVLQRIPEKYDEEFVQMTRYSRAEWEKYLSWMTRSSSIAGTTETPP